MHITPELISLVTGRDSSLFARALEGAKALIEDAVKASRILVIGAAGSIGSAFVRSLVPYSPKALHLVDLSENGLVHLVRDLHGDGLLGSIELHTYAIGFDSVEFEALLRNAGPFDFVLNFAALKHVRSERDEYTLMRLLRVNVLANQKLLENLRGSPVRRFFCVSSDKAVNPASVMGASKAFMERVCLAHADAVAFSSARFANVAFSEGSLLQSFLQRIEKGQPLAAPTDVRRYFISEQEAGQLCLLSAFAGGNREIFTPCLTPEQDLKTFSAIAADILAHFGYRPRLCETQAEAQNLATQRKANDRGWPCLFSGSTTAGEKPFEEFRHEDESEDLTRFENIAVVTNPRISAKTELNWSLMRLADLDRNGFWRKVDLIQLVKAVIPEFQHVHLDANLDQKL